MSEIPETNKKRTARNPKAILFTVLGILLLSGLGYGLVALTREYPVVIRPAFDDQESKMGPNQEYWVAYNIEGDFEPEPGKKYQLVVWGPKPFPYMRIIYGDQLKKGGMVGLAVFKEGWDYRAALREPDPYGEGSRISNYLDFQW